MYHDEIHHLGRPHFYARYGDDEASLTIESVEVLAGGLPPRALRLYDLSHMRSTPLLIEAAALDGYVVSVRFEDGIRGDVDLSYLTEYGGVFEPLKDLEYFRQLRADEEAGTLVWPNDADIAPETLYAHAKRLTTSAA
jgi:hypothetical protein